MTEPLRPSHSAALTWRQAVEGATKTLSRYYVAQNKRGVSVCLGLSKVARICLRLRLSAFAAFEFVNVGLHLRAFARICLPPPFVVPPLRASDIMISQTILLCNRCA